MSSISSLDCVDPESIWIDFIELQMSMNMFKTLDEKNIFINYIVKFESGDLERSAFQYFCFSLHKICSETF